tara:strand:+ start:43 stop:342 length:300 start_codon:yes stop_codon:yes gene_type:complete
MIVEALDRKWTVNEITLKEKRELHRKNVVVWEKVNNPEAESDPGEWIDLLDEVMEKAGLNEKSLVDKEGNSLSMADIDSVLLAIFLEYVGGPGPKESGG